MAVVGSHRLLSRRLCGTLAIKGVEYKFVLTIPAHLDNPKKEVSTQTAEYKKLTKGLARVPFMDDDGFCLGESHAILCYLADKYGWSDFYPKDIKARAKIDEYLHWHHMFGPRQLAPFFGIGKDLNLTSTPGSWKQKIEQSRKLSEKCFEHFEIVLKDQNFLAGDSATLADFSAFEEVVQVLPETTGLFDLSPYPLTLKWVRRMQGLPKYKKFHESQGLPKIFAIAKKKSGAALARL